MKRSLVAALLVIGVAASSANLAFARVDEGFGDLGEKVIDKQYNLELLSRGARLGTSTSPQNTDTLWVGYTPGHIAADNYWSIYSGFGKDGFRRPINGQPGKGIWDFDTPVQGDSLQGWWPIRTRYYGGAGTFNDRTRPFQGIDYGNNSNYRSSTGSRTFGVTGVWHVDGGNTVAAPAGRFEPNWSPSVGAGAAWMGVRAHGDLSYQDPVTGNYFNEDIMQYNIVLPVDTDGNDKGMPGYGAQMDQLLYRDIDFTGKTNQNVTIQFRYRTVMSQGANTAAGTTAGWFNHDPLGNTAGLTNPQLNNYISAEDGGTANAPRDSFMVYIGSGVDGNQWLGSDGILRNVYDAQRRWFAEVLHADMSTNAPGSPTNPQPTLYKELLSVAGNNPVDAATNPFSYVITGFTIPNAALAPFLAKNNRLRLVFRVKTNRATSDETSDYSSNRAGAAVVDAVTYKIGANATVAFGDFDNTNEIDNSIGVSATDKWKSTGKPPAVYMHTHLFGGLPYNDVCGDKGDPGRLCDMTGVVLSVGNHDDSEASNGIQGTAEMDMTQTTFSPSIQLVGPFNQGDTGDKNAQGLRAPGTGPGDIVADELYYVWYEYYSGLFRGSLTGSYWAFGVKSYPGKSKSTHGPGGGYDAWGSMSPVTAIISSSEECLTDFEPVNYFMFTSNVSGIADSVQVGLIHFTRCFRLGLAVCGRDGLGYFDNVSIAVVDGAPIQTSFLPWDFYNDAFPANESAGLPGNKALFDTTAAWLGSGLNTAQVIGSKNRFNIPGDTMFIQATTASGRVDMVFRILPGPGNYEPIGAGHSGNIRRVPSSSATVTPGDGSWWDAYRTNSGAFSSSPNGPMTNLKAGWNPDFWLSARCDTAEVNLYAFQGRSVLGGPPLTQHYCSAYHESDPKYNILGIVHNKCFVRCSASSVNDVICDGTVPTVPGTPACIGYLPGGTLGTTREGTKIIPDGLLTPGAHVEYFFREQKDTELPIAEFSMTPDTNRVFPQLGESSSDAHRWQEFSILPDRWKDPQYTHPTYQLPGRGNAQLLVVDMNDRRGNERVWVSVADTIGSIDPIARGAHNGWTAPGGVDLNEPSNFVSQHGGQAGSRGTWDFYQAKASESSATGGNFGGRLANRIGDPNIVAKSGRQGPTPEMLDAYYTLLFILNGDLDQNFFGPFKDRASDEVALITGWLNNGSTSEQNRGIWVMGDGFVESMAGQTNGNGGQQAMLASHFGVGLDNASYRDFTGNGETPVDLRVHPEFQGKEGGVQYFGVRNVCVWYNDILKLDGIGLNLGSVASEYDGKASPGGANRQIAGVFKDHSASNPVSPWKSLVDGWDIEHLTSRHDRNTVGRSGYFLKIFTNVWAKIWPVAGTPVVPLDVPSFDDGALMNFVTLKNNPLRSGSAEISLGLANADRVEVKVYDVGGRLIRTLVDRNFEAGPHTLVWDGRDNVGQHVARGVYFTQVKYRNANFALAKKLIVLK